MKFEGPKLPGLAKIAMEFHKSMFPPKLKVYLAALYSQLPQMQCVASQLEARGMEITASWVHYAEKEMPRDAIAIMDLEDVDKADIVLSFTMPHGTYTTGGGRHVEFGYALAKGKKCVIIGERENVFHHHPDVEVYETVNDWLKNGDK